MPVIVSVRCAYALTLFFASAVALAQPVAQALPSLAPMIERVSPAVVNISVRGSVEIDNPLTDDPLFRRFFELPENNSRPFQSAGSGVIIDAEQGFLLTNHHVIENADEITITLHDTRTMEARVIGSDAASDIAVLQVEAQNLAEMNFAEASKLRVGDYVVAIGNPFGFSNTVTSGIVSGLGRSRVNPDRDAYEDFIQTDASINPGNSGGALLNLNGELVGINSAILSRTGGNMGIGFAIPVDMARNVMDQLITYGEVSRGLLGVIIVPVDAETAEIYGLSDTSGALITTVNPNSAAEEAGLEINDVIVRVNDRPVRDPGSLRNAIGLLRPGDSVRVGFIRDGREQSLTAVLNPLPTAAAAIAVPERQLSDLELMFEGAEIVPNEGADGVEGLLVARVSSGSPAYERGLRNGDVITHINRQPVRSIAQAREIVANARSVMLQVQRGNRGQLIPMR